MTLRDHVRDSALVKVRAALMSYSPKMLAFTACILGVAGQKGWVCVPQITGSLTVTSDGYVIGNCGEHLGAFLGPLSDLEKNWEKLMGGMDLAIAEREWVEMRWKMVVQNKYGHKG